MPPIVAHCVYQFASDLISKLVELGVCEILQVGGAVYCVQNISHYVGSLVLNQLVLQGVYLFHPTGVSATYKVGA